MPTKEFADKTKSLLATPIRNLGLKIAGTPLEPILDEFRAELERAGVRRPGPRFYLTTEWGVPFGTVAVGIPFYLAHPELTALHAEQAGYVEGLDRADILRYLRHEMGHAVNYAYRLYEDEEWVKLFGSMTQPYLEEYRPKPFSRRYVQHLPGHYAQKHPDEDWAETFAVWMTPGRDWRAEYAGWPTALAKLEFCDRTMARLRDREPAVTADELDEDVGELGYSLEQFYHNYAGDAGDLPAGLDGALRAIFEDPGRPDAAPPGAPRKPAAQLIRRLERELSADVYRWTGHFPERTRRLLRHLAGRAEALRQVYPQDRELEAAAALTTLVTALAMNHVYSGSYLP
jgi:hypothetical protein